MRGTDNAFSGEPKLGTARALRFSGRSIASYRRLLLASLLLGSAQSTISTLVAWAEPESFPSKAQWITAPGHEREKREQGPLPLFRHEFTVASHLRVATLHISGLGHFEAHINGRNVTADVLTPGWTDYRKRVFYDTYDVTALLHQGPNAIGVMLGNGMYDVEETPGRYTKFTRSFGPPKLLLQLDLTYIDGTTHTIVSNDEWKSAPGPITYTSIYGGEDYDARLERPGWDQPGTVQTGWAPAAIVGGPGGALVPETIPPLRRFARHPTVKITHPDRGISVYDLGENFAGLPEITVSGKSGASVKLIAGELLDSAGRVTQKSANAFPSSQNSFTYTLKGTGTEHWSPRFTYYGFRYVQVVPSSASVHVLRLEGRSLHDAVDVNGDFSSSDDLLNRIHGLIDRAILSNMVSVLTDCPHREKLGWLEQTHLAGASLMYNYGLDALYRKMSDDMQDAQLESGLIPSIAPEFPVFEGAFRDSPEWGAAVVLSPWVAYQFYGDPEPLRTHYPSMQRYAAYLQSRLQDGLLTYGLGDWYDIGPGEPGESKLTSKGLTASAIYYQTLTTLSRIATLLGRPDDAARYSAESRSIKQAINARFFHPDPGSYDRGSQTANALPLAIGLVPEEQRRAVLNALVADIRQHSNHVTAGDIGFHYVIRALTDNNRSDVIYDMLSRSDKPSYGDQLARGATTLTEAWDANPNSSQNHFMLGHAEEWFYRGLAGIDFDMSRAPEERMRVQPAIVGNIQSANASLKSKLGLIKSSWSRTGEVLHIEVTVPAAATITLPAVQPADVRLGGRVLAASSRINAIRSGDRTVSFTAAAGQYRFTLPVPHASPR